MASMKQLLYKCELFSHRCVPPSILHVRYCVVMTMSVAREADVEHKEQRDYVTRWAIPQDARQLTEQSSLARPRLLAGDRAVVVMRGSELVGVAWIAVGQYRDHDTGMQFKLLEDAAWLYGVWVRRDLRGQRLYSDIIRFLREQLAADGQSSVYLAVDWSNGHSQRVHRTLGAKQVGAFFGFTLLGSRHYQLRWYSPGCSKSQVEIATFKRLDEQPGDGEKGDQADHGP